MTAYQYTKLWLEDHAYTNHTLPAGTVVYCDGHYFALSAPTTVDIEDRANTNWDNQRRCTIDGVFKFWIKGIGVGD